jgi:hypothetical protein
MAIADPSKIMKIRLYILIVGLAVNLSLGLWRVSAEMEVSVGVSIHANTDFYEPLAPNGTWVDSSYGRCWHPAGVAADWRPYCNGNWEWTDSGWYWVSDEPWAWACYHYGTWAYDPGDGWVWVPGVEWAPAWVNWRMGGDYVGWAPCSPPGFVVVPTFYVFVEGRHFSDHIRPNTVIINNQTVFSHTTETPAARHEDRQFDGQTRSVVVNEGPGVDRIEKATGQKFNAVSVREADRQTFASVPEKFKQRAAEPANAQRPSPVQPQPREEQNSAPERKLTPDRNQELPDRTSPNQELPDKKIIPSDRIVPQSPPEKAIPQNKEMSPGREQQQQHEIAPPAQSPTPRENPDQGNGQGNEKDKDHGGQDMP